MITQIARPRAPCPVCGAHDTSPLLSIPRVPVFCNQICGSRQDAVQAPTASIELCFCPACGHAFNAVFEPSRVQYGPQYENSLHCSSTFQGYAEALADRLLDRHRLRGKRIVEVGCGQGDFLRLLATKGGNVGFGYDPSYNGDDEGQAVDGVTVCGAPYSSDALADLGADFVCCRHVLEHVADPVAFLRGMRRAAGRPDSTPVFFEVPNALYTLRRNGIWDLIYEHCNYFTPSSLQRAFLEAGFVVDSVETTFGGQFLTIHARAFHRPVSRGLSDSGDPSTLRARTDAFADRYRAMVDAWSARLAAYADADHGVAVWGAGSKGSTFVNVVPRAEEAVSALVDINPRKQGAYVAGSGLPIVAPKALVDASPEAVIVMNSIYGTEIAAEISVLGLSPAILSADELPSPR